MPMPARASAIYGKIQAFAFDTAIPGLPFHRQLARENGWTAGYAARAISEYRRFLLLAVSVDHAVVPSCAVEEVWRLHLIHTHSYWERLCRDVLGRALHHDAGTREAARSDGRLDDYARTLKTYQQFFDGPAPTDIWPAAGASIAGSIARIDRRDFFVIRKPWRRS